MPQNMTGLQSVDIDPDIDLEMDPDMEPSEEEDQNEPLTIQGILMSAYNVAEIMT